MRPPERRSRHRIAVVVPALELGGGVPAVADFICRSIESAGYELRLISLSQSSDDHISVRLRHPSSWLAGAQTENGSWNGRPFIRVGSELAEFEFQRYSRRKQLTSLFADCDLIQVVCGSPAWALPVCGIGKPVLVQCATRAVVERRTRDRSATGAAGMWRRLMTRVVDHLERRALTRVDAVQVENPWMLEYATKLNSGRKTLVRYAPPGIDARLFCPSDTRDLGPEPYLFCVGRLDDVRKNALLLLEAYDRLCPSIKAQVRLVLAGSAGPSAEFWNRADRSGLRNRVSFINAPDTATLIRLYQGATAFVSSSDEEGLGVAILEAMSCGVPVVSTASGGPDGIITEGRDGYLVPVGDAQAICDRLIQLISNPDLNKAMGLAARATILERYATQVASRAFLDMFEELLERDSDSLYRPA